MVPLDDAVQRLKNEILSQDWRLSSHRIERLEEALSCLRKRFRSRKAMFSILTMAVNVLDYKKKKGDDCQPEAIDFLKESMAHMVNLSIDSGNSVWWDFDRQTVKKA